MFSKDDLQRLLAVDGAPAVTITMPTHIAGREIRQDVIRLKNLIAKAQDDLCDKHGLRRPEAESVLQPVAALLDRGDFWRHQDRGLAVFLAKDVTAIHRVPVPVPEGMTVGSRFALRSLLPLLADDGNFMILAVSAGQARLCSATRHGIAEEAIDLPRGVAEIDAETNYDEDVRNSAPQARHGDRTDRGGVGMVKTNNFGEAPEELRKAHLISYVGRVCAKVQDHLKLYRGPLILVAEDEIQGHVRKNTHPRALIEPRVVANPDALEPEELHRRAYEAVRPLFEQARHAALEHFRSLNNDRSTVERTSTRADEVLVAAREGRVGTLLVAENDKVWGVFREDYHRAFPHHHETDGAIDLVEHSVTETLLHGGVVHVLAKAELPPGVATAAILRF